LRQDQHIGVLRARERDSLDEYSIGGVGNLTTGSIDFDRKHPATFRCDRHPQVCQPRRRATTTARDQLRHTSTKSATLDSFYCYTPRSIDATITRKQTNSYERIPLIFISQQDTSINRPVLSRHTNSYERIHSPTPYCKQTPVI
jgi:hypothetical protein